MSRKDDSATGAILSNIQPCCRLLFMRITIFSLAIVAALSMPHANALNHWGAPDAPTSQHESTPTAQAATQGPASADKTSVTNVDDSMAHWSTCAQPECYPGGKGIPVSTDQTINNSSPSVDGASMLLAMTANSKAFYTDVLWPYKTRGCDACTQMRTDFWAYPVSPAHVAALEYDAFLFDATNQLNIMWGVQWNQRKGRWQIWNQGKSQWMDTTVTSGPTFGVWNHLQFADHRVIGDTACDGTECLYYDSMTLNGTTYTLNLTEPAGPIHPGWHSVAGFQFQLDATPAAGGPVTLVEYIDKANMSAK